MTISIKKAALAVLVSIGALGTVPATASATSIDLYFGTHGSGIQLHEGRRDHRWGDRDRHHGRSHWRHRRGCSSREAVRKAHYFGVRHARVVHESRRVVVVSGVKHHRRDQVVFANVDGCPLIRR